MNIAYFLRFWPQFGGGETVTRVLANELCKRNHSVSIYYLWDRTSGVDTKLDSRLKVRKVEGISKTNIHGVIKKCDYKLIEEQFKDFCKQDNIQIVINQWIPANLCLNIVKHLDVKLITCNHGMIKFVPAKLKTLKEKIFYTVFGDNAGFLRIYWKYKPAVKYSDRYVCLCEPYVNDIIKLYHVKDTTKIISIPNPCAYAEKSKDIINKKQKEIIYVGRIIDIKRVNLMIDIWRSIQEKSFAKDWRFTIIGEGPDLDTNIKYAKETNCERLSFEGFKNPEEYYERASLFVFASCQEGWGLVLVEAQIHGCVPIVMNSSPCFQYIIKDGESGFLVKDNDINAFSKTLEKIMTDSNERNKIAVKSMNSAKKFLASNIVLEWEKLFNDLVNQ